MVNNDILNMVTNIFTRKITKNVILNKSFDIKFLFNVLNICLGFAVYLKFTKYMIPNNFTEEKKNKAFENVKKYGTMLIVTNLIKGNIFSLSFVTLFINTLAAFSIYFLFLDDMFTISSKFKNIVVGFIESLIFQILENDNINFVDYPDLLGRFIYDSLVSKYIKFD